MFNILAALIAAGTLFASAASVVDPGRSLYRLGLSADLANALAMNLRIVTAGELALVAQSEVRNEISDSNFRELENFMEDLGLHFARAPELSHLKPSDRLKLAYQGIFTVADYALHPEIARSVLDFSLEQLLDVETRLFLEGKHWPDTPRDESMRLVTEIPFGKPLAEALETTGVRYLREIALVSEAEYLAQPYFGETKMRDLKRFAANQGFVIGQDLVFPELPPKARISLSRAGITSRWFYFHELKRARALIRLADETVDLAQVERVWRGQIVDCSLELELESSLLMHAAE